MYPKLSDLINDLLGLNINLPIQTYGFFVAIAFLVAALILYYELKRKENEGLLESQFKKRIKGKPASSIELTISGAIGFLIGFKLVGAALNYTYFADNPQDFLFSGEGSYLGGIAFAAYSVVSDYRKKNKEKLENPIEVRVEVHPYQLTGTILIIAAVSGIIGAKLFHQFENWNEFVQDPWGSLFSFSGLTFYGGLIVATVVLIFYSKKNKIHWVHLADAVAPALLLAYAIGRIGCHTSGDGDWGIVNLNPQPGWLAFLPDWMWAFDYPHNVLSTGIPIEGCTGPNCFKLPQPVYPTSFYETTMCTLLFMGLWFSRKKIAVPGILFSIYLIMNGVERFFIEKIRVNETYDILGAKITQAEIISTILVLIGISGIFYFRNKAKKIKEKAE